MLFENGRLIIRWCSGDLRGWGQSLDKELVQFFDFSLHLVNHFMVTVLHLGLDKLFNGKF